MAKKYYGKEEKDKHRSDYSHFESLNKLIKKRSPLIIEFVKDKKDEDFIEVLTYRRRTGLITKSSLILRDQMEDWIDRFERIVGFQKADDVDE